MALGLVTMTAPPAWSQPADDPIPPEHEGYHPAHGDGLGEGLAGEGGGFPSFNESAGCGPPSTSNPLHTRSGPLSSPDRIRGYRGDFFGRTIGQLSSELVNWTVPLSGGKVVRVHERALPAFQKAGANLVAAAAANPGKPYRIRSGDTATYVPRTVGGSFSISNHTFGATIDINWTTNPYRSDNTKITDMPDWFVQAWRDAGFCWGGDWMDIKDTMHFSWMGPNATPGYGTVPKPYPPTTSPANFTTLAATYDVAAIGPTEAGKPQALADFTGNGLADVVEVGDAGTSLLVEFSRTHQLHRACAASSFVVPAVTRRGRLVAYADYERHGRTDIWFIDSKGSTVAMEVALRSKEFKKTVKLSTAVKPSAGAAYLLGDHNRDGVQDLFVIRRSATATRVEVWNGKGGYKSKLADTATPLGDTRSWQFTLGDRNVDDLPDLYAIDRAKVRILLNGYGTVNETRTLPASGAWADVLANDFDGDGRDDLFLLRTNGVLDVYLGNTAIPGASPTSWFVPAGWKCDTATADNEAWWCTRERATILGTSGNDVIYGTKGNDIIWAGRGHDVIHGRGGNDVICGGSGNDRVYAGPGNDVVFGGSGADTIHGGVGDDLILGGTGKDRLYGEGGVDRLYGQRGDDEISGGSDADLLYGGPGNDKLGGGTGRDTLRGAGGDDRLRGGSDSDYLHGGGGHDRLWGNTGNDLILGGTGDDLLYGGKGNDTLHGEAGGDILRGGDGSDTVDGGAGNDTLYGNAGPDLIRGGAGADALYGGSGADDLRGGGNTDTCHGGSGTDTATRCEVKVSIP